jgi:integrase
MRAFLLCGWLAGLRLNEAFELEREQTDLAPWVDFGRRRIWLPAAFTKAVADQWIPLDAALSTALENLPSQGRKVFRFQDKRDGHLIGVQGVCKRIVALAHKAAVRLTMKSLRKGFGCYYANRVSAHVLQKLMRHANISTTLDYYANFDAAVEDAVFSRNPSQQTGSVQAHERNALRNNDIAEPDRLELPPDATGEAADT